MTSIVGSFPSVEQKEETYDPLAIPDVDKYVLLTNICLLLPITYVSTVPDILSFPPKLFQVKPCVSCCSWKYDVREALMVEDLFIVAISLSNWLFTF